MKRPVRSRSAKDRSASAGAAKSGRVLPRRFYAGTPDVVARGLLGKVLARRLDGEWLTGRIVETEAYFGQDDPAAHAYAGKTERNAVLFGPPGHVYVYFIYGMHWCLNVSCEPDGQPGGVLFRAMEPLTGLETMARLRGTVNRKLLAPGLIASGPGRLCQAMAITRAGQNGADVTSRASELQIWDDGYKPGRVRVTPRIGIKKAVEKLHRFVLEDRG
jgi:DNA-3-methyladenine glycosylase